MGRTPLVLPRSGVQRCSVRGRRHLDSAGTLAKRHPHRDTELTMLRKSANGWTTIAALALILIMAAMPGANAAGDAARGQALAEQWCTGCHIVSASQKSANADVPSFFDIAKRADGNLEPLAVFLADPHPPMPNLGLSRNEISDLLAYIGSLN